MGEMNIKDSIFSCPTYILSSKTQHSKVFDSYRSSVLHLPGGIAQGHLATGSLGAGRGDQGSLARCWRTGRDPEG